MILYPELHRIQIGDTSAEEARVDLRRLMDQHGSDIHALVYHALRCWTTRVLTSGRTDAEELDKWFSLLQAIRVTMNRRESTDEYLKMQVLVDILFDYLLKLSMDAAKAADSTHYEFIAHRQLGRFKRRLNGPLDFGEGTIVVNDLTFHSQPARAKFRPQGVKLRRRRYRKGDLFFIQHTEAPKVGVIDRDWFERKVALEGDLEVGVGFDLLHAVSQKDDE